MNMKIKTIIKSVLLLFVLTSVAYLIVEQVQSNCESLPAQTNLQEVEEPNTLSSQQEISKVIVYYFYNSIRCQTCRKFESFTNEALQRAFSDAMKTGRLEWLPINVDEPDNKHFVTDYQLFTKSVIVAKIQVGEQTEWKNLNKIWELVRDKQTFIKYVQNEVRNCLGAD